MDKIHFKNYNLLKHIHQDENVKTTIYKKISSSKKKKKRITLKFCILASSFVSHLSLFNLNLINLVDLIMEHVYVQPSKQMS